MLSAAGRRGMQVRRFTDLVRVVEVGPRDGLQNVKKIVPTATKIELVEKLADAGLRSIEVTSFVSPKWVPQMADNAEVWRGLKKRPEPVEYLALVPNERGLEAALATGVREVVLFLSATEGFSRRNINCSVAESLERARRLRAICAERGLRTRGVLSCVVGCPYEGAVAPKQVAPLVEALLDMGCYEVGLGDTIGVGSPASVGRLLAELKVATGDQLWRLAAHLHDTYGQAVANVYECLRHGVRVFDSSVAGLGGCPYAPGAAGNLATEDLLYLLHGQGMQTGVDLAKVAQVGDFISKHLQQPNHSKAGRALLAAEARKRESSAAEKSCN